MRISAVFVFCVTAFAAGPSPVADAAMKGDTQSVRRLIAQKADVNAPQPDGATAIQWAAFRNNLELADVLIAAFASRFQGLITRNADDFLSITPTLQVIEP